MDIMSVLGIIVVILLVVLFGALITHMAKGDMKVLKSIRADIDRHQEQVQALSIQYDRIKRLRSASENYKNLVKSNLDNAKKNLRSSQDSYERWVAISGC